MEELKPVIWIGSSRKDLKAFPRAVQRNMGQAIFAAQAGGRDPAARPMKGFKGVAVMEIVETHRTDTYRAIYTVKFGDYVFVLHAFQKKSKTGIKTPKVEMDLIKQRLADAKRIWQEMNNEKA